MQTVNTYFKSYKKLDKFIEKNDQIQTSNALLIQLFSGIIDKEFLEELTTYLLSALPHAKIIGATTDGEILNKKVSQKKVVISFTSFEKSTISIAYENSDANEDSFYTGEQLATKLLNDDAKLFILFSSGLTINGEEFLNGVKKAAPEIIVAGGMAGDNAEFNETYILANNHIQSTGAVGISINSKELYIHNDYSLAWANLGKTFTINKSNQNVVYDIDGMTPYCLYKKYLGDDVANELPGIGVEFPLLIQKDDHQIARAVLKVNGDGSMVFAGNLKEGEKVRFGIGNIKEVLHGSSVMLNTLETKYSESIFIYSCMARRRFLDKKSYLDFKNFSHVAPVSGFFTYGEFFSTKESNELFNESLTLISLSENQTEKKPIDLESPTLSAKKLLKQKALSHLINITSNELDQLNVNLEEKVKEKVEQNAEYEKYIFQQEKMAQMGEMIENIAHQWRQPLSAISSNASSIIIQDKLGLLESEVLEDTMESVITNTKFLSDTIDTFRNFIKEEKEFKEVIFQERLDTTIGIVTTTLNDYKIKLINEIDYSHPIKIKMIVGEFSQVLLNIMNNAKDALLERKIIEPWIKITCKLQKGVIITTIEDNAGGIPSKVINKIFDPYFTTKHKSKGTGIGLYMSHSIITSHLKGKLCVKNSKNGAKFTIEIPL